MKEPCVRKFEGLARSKVLGISQTRFKEVNAWQNSLLCHEKLVLVLVYNYSIQRFMIVNIEFKDNKALLLNMAQLTSSVLDKVSINQILLISGPILVI